MDTKYQNPPPSPSPPLFRQNHLASGSTGESRVASVEGHGQQATANRDLRLRGGRRQSVDWPKPVIVGMERSPRSCARRVGAAKGTEGVSRR